MPTVAESAIGRRTQLNATLVTGERTLSEDQKITFTRYVRLVLPLDGFVFWVRADLISSSAVPNTALANSVGPGDPGTTEPAEELEIRGSIHYTSVQGQDETESYANNRVIFTSEKEIRDFNDIGPTVLYIGTFQGVRFAFSSRESFYEQADIHHYVGDSINSSMATQIIDDPGAVDAELVVSNSLPIWLSLAHSTPYPGLDGIGVPIFPSFAVPNNQRPPYVTIHVAPESLEAWQIAPRLDRTYSHSQLVRERVRISTYGMRNRAAMDFLDYVNQFTLNTELMGLVNSPVPRDEKEPEPAFTILAMRKTFDFDINYYQSQARNVARQLILSAIPSYIIDPDAPRRGVYDESLWNSGDVWA